ncbi:MAG: formyltransferase family protein [Candidatus Dojkabacteria bacterium]|nr:MAG: formyltransferase family protein [Candidatus Dojkabacteria bacterium]
MIYLFSSTPEVLEQYFSKKNIDYTLVPKESCSEFLASLDKLDRKDWGISFNYGKIFPAELLQKIKIVNVHFSLLPKYRGAVPVEAAVLNGDTVSGITLQWTSEGLDEGDIIMMRNFDLPVHTPAGDIRSLYIQQLPQMFEDLFKLSENPNDWESYPQQGESSYCNKAMLSRENAFLSFGSLTANEIYRRVFAFNPNPYAWCDVEFNGQKTTMNIMQAEVIGHPTHVAKQLKPGEISWLKGRGMVIGTLLGYILVTEAIVAGRKVLKNGDIVAMKGNLNIIV